MGGPLLCALSASAVADSGRLAFRRAILPLRSQIYNLKSKLMCNLKSELPRLCPPPVPLPPTRLGPPSSHNSINALWQACEEAFQPLETMLRASQVETIKVAMVPARFTANWAWRAEGFGAALPLP